MKNLLKLVLVVLLSFGYSTMAQQKMPAGESGVMSSRIVVPSIAQQIADGTIVLADNKPALGRAKGHSGPNIVPGKGSTGNDPLVNTQRSQEVNMTQSRAPMTTFVADISTSTPSDPTGAAGPNHYVAAWNVAFRIFDKDGAPLTPELSLATLFPGNAIGDPIVFFDANVDNGAGEPRGRFVITEFDNNPNGFNFAVSAGPDPVNDEWYIYTDGLGTGAFPDYTKFAVWGDSYIVTANIGQTNRVFAVERNQMLENQPAQFAAFPLPGIVTSGFYSPHGFHITGDETVPAGTPAPIVYMQDDAWAGVSEDHLKIWEATLDWANPANHSIELAQEITTADFVSVFDGGSFSNIPQPTGPDVDALQATMMQQVQYRRFGTHNSVVMNFVVDVLEPGEKAGIRWYELRQTADGEPWTIYQEGTYVAPGGKRSAFQGSMVMDSEGNIGLGYISSSEENFVGMHYTGRFDGDPLGVMTVNEQLVFQSTAACPTDRLADYTQLSIDPANDSFWFISEQFDPSRRDVVVNFTLDPAQPNDLSIFSILSPVGDAEYTDDEDVTATIRNYGSNAITNPMLQYTVNGGAPVVEMFTGTIEPGLSVEFTFNQGADLSAPDTTFTIDVSTLLDGDSNPDNDSVQCIARNTAGQSCMPETTGGCNVDGIKQFILGTINTDDGANGCNTEPAGGPQGYADRRDLSTDLDRNNGDNVHLMQIQQNWNGSVGVSAVSAWIDFNDDTIFEASEQLIEEEFFEVFGELDDFDLVIPTDAPLGSHTLRVRSIDTSGAGDINNPCGDVQFGETQDYTVNIIDTLSVDDSALEDSAFTVSTLDNNVFTVNVQTSFDGRGAITVYNLAGQRLTYNNIKKEGNSFNHTVDMSHVSAGVYIVKFLDIDGNSSLIKKIIVK